MNKILVWVLLVVSSFSYAQNIIGVDINTGDLHGMIRQNSNEFYTALTQYLITGKIKLYSEPTSINPIPVKKVQSSFTDTVRTQFNYNDFETKDTSIFVKSEIEQVRADIKNGVLSGLYVYRLKGEAYTMVYCGYVKKSDLMVLQNKQTGIFIELINYKNRWLKEREMGKNIDEYNLAKAIFDTLQSRIFQECVYGRGNIYSSPFSDLPLGIKDRKNITTRKETISIMIDPNDPYNVYDSTIIQTISNQDTLLKNKLRIYVADEKQLGLYIFSVAPFISLLPAGVSGNHATRMFLKKPLINHVLNQFQEHIIIQTVWYKIYIQVDPNPTDILKLQEH